jgi:hypothetical protein
MNRDEARRRREGCANGVKNHVIGSAEGGAALVVALLLTGFLLLLGSAMLTMAGSERQIGLNDQAGAQALNQAEAAVERARSVLPRFAPNDVVGNNLLLGSWVHGTPLGSGTYQAIVTNNNQPIGGYPSDPLTPTCASCDSDGLLVVIATGSYQGASRTVRALVEIPPIMQLPAPLTFVNSVVDARFDGESFLISGFDRNIDGSPGSATARPAIAVVTSEAVTAVENALTEGQRSRVLGAGATPSVQSVSTVPTRERLERLKYDLARQADRTLINPMPLSESLQRVDGGGQVTLMKGDPSGDNAHGLDTAGDAVLEGAGHGAGMLVVTGELTIRGSYRFDGVVLLVGDGSRVILEADAVITGAVIIANRSARNSGMAGVTIRDRATLYFSQEVLQQAAQLLSAPLRAWQEVSEQ